MSNIQSGSRFLIFEFSALSLAMGVILYISSVNDEVAHRKKIEVAPDKIFSYQYGWAFFFGAATFLCAMVAAVSNISLYIRRFSPVDDKLSIMHGGPSTDHPSPNHQLSRTFNHFEPEVITVNRNLSVIL